MVYRVHLRNLWCRLDGTDGVVKKFSLLIRYTYLGRFPTGSKSRNFYEFRVRDGFQPDSRWIPWIPLICGERHAKIAHPVFRKYSLKKPSRFVVQRPGKHEPIQPGIRMFSWSDLSHSRKTYEFRVVSHTKNPEFLRIPGFSIRLETALTNRI